ncbi:unnamed protein product [Rotaria socialis]|uniref:Uncharacterized protein n=1 Tax=Rotaria socialis TaxID=392032 RepID=A0A821UZA5_9BILA|nr:unnamed protein product [Rotaria socialis]
MSVRIRDAPIPSPTNPIPILGLELVGIDSNWNWNWNWFRIGLKQLPLEPQLITYLESAQKTDSNNLYFNYFR